MSVAPTTGVGPVVGASLLDDEGPPPATAPEKTRKPRAKKEPAPKPTEATRTLPAPKPPTDVEVAKASATVAAAQQLGGREPISHELSSLFEAEEQALAEIRHAPARDAEETRLLMEALRAHDALIAEHDRNVAARLQAIVIDAASVGHAIDEVKFWEEEAERTARLYEARTAKAKQKAERAMKLLWPLVKAHCEAVQATTGATWTFPTTQWTVRLTTDRQGHLEVADAEQAAKTLQKLVGPEDASKAIKVQWQVYVKESRAILEKVMVEGKPLDLSKVVGFKFTKPGTESLGIRWGG